MSHELLALVETAKASTRSRERHILSIVALDSKCNAEASLRRLALIKFVQLE